MKYKLDKCAWDITSRCNLNCLHCSEKNFASENELTTKEALELADQIAELGTEWVTFTGGEPLTRPDWDMLASRLRERGVCVEIISNGTLLNQEMLQRIIKSHVSHVAISVDGPEKIHDQIRGKGVFAGCREAFTLLGKEGISRAAVTTLMKENLGELEALKEKLVDWNVPLWQLQIAVPVGGMEDHKESLISPQDMNLVLDFCYRTALEGNIKIAPADCIGYYSKKEAIVRGFLVNNDTPPVWQGCRAGLSSLTIRSDGNIVGISLCREENSQGNIREKSLREIWEKEDNFAFARRFHCEKMEGYCGKCQYLSKCRGGCTIMKYGFGGSVYAENQYCLYRSHIAEKGLL